MARKLISQLSLSLLLVVSQANAQSYGELRLTQRQDGGSNYAAGLLEIFLNEEWGTICDAGFDMIDANVACRQMGYKAAVSFTIGFHSPYGIGRENSSVWLSDIDCRDSNGLHLLSCAHGQVGEHDCDHFSDVAVVCDERPLASYLDNGSFRLTGGQHTSEGIVEIACNEQWKTVCGSDERFGQTEADAVCWQLGFTQASNFEPKEAVEQNSSSNDTLDNQTENITSYNIKPCTGEYHSCTFTCSSNPDGTCLTGNERNRTTPSAIWIECNHTITYGTLRLTDVAKSNDTEVEGGRLEMFGEGKWGTVCGVRFGSTEANVACRQLGYFRASHYTQSNSSRIANTGSAIGHNIALTSVECSIEDEELAYCSRPELPEGVVCTRDNDIILTCTNDPYPVTTEGEIASKNSSWPLPFSKRVLIEISAGVGVGLILCCCCLIVWCSYCCCQRSTSPKYQKQSQNTMSLNEDDDSETKEPDVIILAATIMDQLKPSPVPCTSPVVPKDNDNSTNSENGAQVFFPGESQVTATSTDPEGAACTNAAQAGSQNGNTERERQTETELQGGGSQDSETKELTPKEQEHKDGKEKERQRGAGNAMEPIPEEEECQVNTEQHPDGAAVESESKRDHELALDLAAILESMDGNSEYEQPGEIKIL